MRWTSFVLFEFEVPFFVVVFRHFLHNSAYNDYDHLTLVVCPKRSDPNWDWQIEILIWVTCGILDVRKGESEDMVVALQCPSKASMEERTEMGVGFAMSADGSFCKGKREIGFMYRISGAWR